MIKPLINIRLPFMLLPNFFKKLNIVKKISK